MIAQLIALTANINRDEKKKPDPFTPADFIPDYSKQIEGREETREEKLQRFRQLWNELKDG